MRLHKWLVGSLVVLLLLFGYVSWQFGLFAQPHKAAPLVTPEASSEAENQPDRINILLLGIDSRVPGGPGRSDIMLLLSVDLVNQQAALLSIPRDTRVEIPGRGLDKINHAHAFGGVQLAMQTVANAFQVPIHHWIRIDMTAMTELVDRFGPVTVQVPLALTLRDGTQVGPGPVPMDGRLAMLYLRERYSDPIGDVGRSERAQGFLMDLARHLMREVGPAEIPRLYTILRNYADTDIRLQDGFWQRVLQIHPDSVQRGTVRGRGIMIDDIYYYEVDWEQTEEVLRSLGLRR
ncbi:MAG TPA: LCP family protein [Symbiobacteriaceae bacterium]